MIGQAGLTYWRGKSGGGVGPVPEWRPPITANLFEGWQGLLKYMWQDNAATIPVTTAGQTVGAWVGFKSGLKLIAPTINQPKADFSGSIWGLDFTHDAHGKLLQVVFSQINQPITIYVVTSQPPAVASEYIWDGADSVNRCALLTKADGTGSPDLYAGNEVIGSSAWISGLSAYAAVYNGAASFLRYKSTTVTDLSGNAGSNSLAGLTLNIRYDVTLGPNDLLFRCVLIYTAAHSDSTIDTNLASMRTNFAAS